MSNILLTAFDRGHARNPAQEFRETWNVSREDIETGVIDERHPTGKLIMRSYQQFHSSEMDTIAFALHGGRQAVLDGDVGPATEQLFQAPRCAIPDFYVEDVPKLAAMYNGPHQPGVLPENEIQAANWPGTCRGKLTFNFLGDSLPGLSGEETFRAFTIMCNIWTRVIDDMKIKLWKEQNDPQKLDIYGQPKPLPGGTLAWSFLARNTCQVSLQQKYDTTVRWSLAQLVATATHEVGHAIGMNHNNQSGSLLYPSITSALINRWGWPARVDLAQCQRLGYQVQNLNPERPAPESMFKGWWEGGDNPIDPKDPPGDAVGTLTLRGEQFNIVKPGGNDNDGDDDGWTNPF